MREAEKRESVEAWAVPFMVADVSWAELVGGWVGCLLCWWARCSDGATVVEGVKACGRQEVVCVPQQSIVQARAAMLEIDWAVNGYLCRQPCCARFALVPGWTLVEFLLLFLVDTIPTGSGTSRSRHNPVCTVRMELIPQ